MFHLRRIEIETVLYPINNATEIYSTTIAATDERSERILVLTEEKKTSSFSMKNVFDVTFDNDDMTVIYSRIHRDSSEAELEEILTILTLSATTKNG